MEGSVLNILIKSKKYAPRPAKLESGTVGLSLSVEFSSVQVRVKTVGGFGWLLDGFGQLLEDLFPKQRLR